MTSILEIKIAKIVGAGNHNLWSQVHAFTPQSEDPKMKLGSLVAVFSLESKIEGLEVASFGMEIIQRFHETFYSAASADILQNLKDGVGKTCEEFKEKVNLGITCASVGGTPLVVYGACKTGSAYILRDGILASLLLAETGKESVSGYLKAGDVIIIGTADFFKFVSEPVLEGILLNSDLEKIQEELATIIGTVEHNASCGAAVIAVQEKYVEPQKETKNIIDTIKQKLMPVKKNPVHIYLAKTGSKAGRKKVSLSAAIILLGLLCVSIILGFGKRNTQKTQELEQSLFSKASFDYEQGRQLSSINPVRAKDLFAQAKVSLDQIPGDKLQDQVKALTEKINQAMQGSLGQYQTEATLFLDLNLIKNSFIAAKMAYDEGVAAILDTKNGSIITIELDSKKGTTLVGSPELKNAKLIGQTPNFVFWLDNQNLTLVDGDTGDAIATKKIDGLGKISDLVGFSGNAYLLGNSQIYKFTALDKSISDKQNYLIKDDDNLSDGVSMAIDGSVWVITKYGDIYKYTRGLVDSFYLQGLDKPFSQDLVLFTDKECDNLYVLDRKNTRVVVIDKKGIYKKSYVWPGIAGVANLAVSETLKKIYLLSGSRLYTLDLAN